MSLVRGYSKRWTNHCALYLFETFFYVKSNDLHSWFNITFHKAHACHLSINSIWLISLDNYYYLLFKYYWASPIFSLIGFVSNITQEPTEIYIVQNKMKYWLLFLGSYHFHQVSIFSKINFIAMPSDKKWKVCLLDK